jgi:hypothetical protein
VPISNGFPGFAKRDSGAIITNSTCRRDRNFNWQYCGVRAILTTDDREDPGKEANFSHRREKNSEQQRRISDRRRCYSGSRLSITQYFRAERDWVR